jgi:hypothetical protein
MMVLPAIIDDTNFSVLTGDGTSIIVNGERRLLSRIPKPAGHDTRHYSRPFGDVFKVIPRSEWSARCKEQAAKKMRVSDHQRFRPTDQNGLPTCWAAGTCHAFTTSRAVQGLSLIFISPCSIAVPISGGHSGGYEGDAVKYFTQSGGVREENWGPHDTNRSLMNDPKCLADRKLFISLETLELTSADEFATACLLGFPCTVAYDWWSHVVSLADLVEISANDWGFRIRNNWGEWEEKNDAGFSGYKTMRLGKGTPDSGFVFRQVLASAA